MRKACKISKSEGTLHTFTQIAASLKKRIPLENTPRRIPTSCIPEFLLRELKSMECFNPRFWPHDLDL